MLLANTSPPKPPRIQVLPALAFIPDRPAWRSASCENDGLTSRSRLTTGLPVLGSVTAAECLLLGG
jgi:hypothetical protein